MIRTSQSIRIKNKAKACALWVLKEATVGPKAAAAFAEEAQIVAPHGLFCNAITWQGDARNFSKKRSTNLLKRPS